MDISLIANSGIQIFRFPIEIDTAYKGFYFLENYNEDGGECNLKILHEVKSDDGVFFYDREELSREGFLTEDTELTKQLLDENAINAICSHDSMEDFENDVFKIFRGSLKDLGPKNNIKVNRFNINSYINTWLPIPYPWERNGRKQKMIAFDWARIKLIPNGANGAKQKYIAVLAFDTRAKYDAETPNNFVVFQSAMPSMEFCPCTDSKILLAYAFGNKEGNWNYINDYLFRLAYPDTRIQDVSDLKGIDVKRYEFVAAYVSLIDYISKNCDLPKVQLVKDTDTPSIGVDMIVDIGNSRTSALLAEKGQFDLVSKLDLRNYSEIVTSTDEQYEVLKELYREPEDFEHIKSFDMRLAFNELKFGDINKTSSQFVYPSFVRLGEEANMLIHKAKKGDYSDRTTYSSPKRFLWDSQRSAKDWMFMGDEKQNERTIYIKGINEKLTSKGDFATDNAQIGIKANYPRRVLMTFAILEMLTQAFAQVNSQKYRNFRGLGNSEKVPRYISRLVLSCPTAMSDEERKSLVNCAKTAIRLLTDFYGWSSAIKVEPVVRTYSEQEEEKQWRYDEATCALLVYLYGEIGYKYKGASREFLELYGEKRDGSDEKTLRVASVDIGAGTTDLMISQVKLEEDSANRKSVVVPEPLFYDSYYKAGDDLMRSLINKIIYRDECSALYQSLKSKISPREYQQKIDNLVGRPSAQKSNHDRNLQRDLNLQYAVPVMQKMLELASKNSMDDNIEWTDIFNSKTEPSAEVLDYVQRYLDVDLKTVVWQYKRNDFNEMVRVELDALLEKVASIIYAYDVDIVLLSGRPSSLPAVRDALLNYYPVSPDRIITLNNYFVGKWYPFCKNTGFISDPKTIVSVGAMIGYCASKGGVLDNFSVNTNKLATGLKSTSKYVLKENGEIILSPTMPTSTMTLNAVPKFLSVKQLDIKEYPSRDLYVINWDRDAIEKKVLKGFEVEPEEGMLRSLVEEEIAKLKAFLPISITIDRDADFIEHLVISSATDYSGNTFPVQYLRVDVQSLGANDQFWLDSGIIE